MSNIIIYNKFNYLYDKYNYLYHFYLQKFNNTIICNKTILPEVELLNFLKNWKLCLNYDDNYIFLCKYFDILNQPENRFVLPSNYVFSFILKSLEELHFSKKTLGLLIYQSLLTDSYFIENISNDSIFFIFQYIFDGLEYFSYNKISLFYVLLFICYSRRNDLIENVNDEIIHVIFMSYKETNNNEILSLLILFLKSECIIIIIFR